MPAMSPETARRITLVAVNGAEDCTGEAIALMHCSQMLPHCPAVLCSRQRPDFLPAHIRHVPIAPLGYEQYSIFMMYLLWSFVETEYALTIQQDGWVLNAECWCDDWLRYDYIGAPCWLARVDSAEGTRWKKHFTWTDDLHQPHRTVLPVLNGGFSLRSQRLMRALLEHPHIMPRMLPPDIVEDNPPRIAWSFPFHNEDVQLTAVLRPELEAAGLRFPPLEVALGFSIEHAAPAFLRQGMDAGQLFGHHASPRRLVALHPPTVRYRIPPGHIENMFGETDIIRLLQRRGYQVQCLTETLDGIVTIAPPDDALPMAAQTSAEKGAPDLPPPPTILGRFTTASPTTAKPTCLPSACTNSRTW